MDAVLDVTSDALRAGAGRDTHHLHLTTPDSALSVERLAFRDALRADPALVAEYRALEQRLLDSRGGHQYSGADERDFVRRVLAGAGAELTEGLHE